MNFLHQFDQVFSVEVEIAAAVFAVVLAVLLFGLIRYRGGRRDSASQQTEHPRLESVYTVVLLVVALSLFGYTFHANSAESLRATPAVTIHVTGFQWCWEFDYEQPAARVTGDCLHGHYPEVVVPTGEPIKFLVRSNDVIHAFWIPHFRYKIDAFPTHTNFFTTRIAEPGTWEGRCAEFCGEDHYTMLFRLRAVPPDQYRQWVTAQAQRTAEQPS